MKTALILITILSMTGYENYIGKYISEFPDFKELVKVDHGYSDYEIDGKFKFFNATAKSISIETNDKDNIQNIQFMFKARIQKELYTSMVEKYGVPDKMFKLGAIKETSKTVTDSYIATSTSGVSQDCTFEEVPLIIM